MNMLSILKLCRPGQWIKNVFVFLPLFFSGNLLSRDIALHSCIAFVAFCLASSSIYCLNDLRDAEYDRLHPVKRFRPVASGAVGKMTCLMLFFILAICSVILPLFILPFYAAVSTAIVIALYLILNVGYCYWLKKIAVIDVMIISLGFVLRVLSGATSTSITPSHWIIIMTFLLALFLALSKRRDDIMIFNQTGQQMRSNVEKYNLNFMNQAITMVGTVMLVSYIMYTVSAEVMERFHCGYVYATALFVLLGLLRYMQLTIVFSRTGSPTKVLKHDRLIQMCVIGWILMFAFIIYF